ncbi:MAG: hypothetical protein PHC66_00260 [Candidatus Nanoarchaeia archaeon]|nr:hypothetical protein [Candidatus Nanoarchaeia archaeon]MDD5239618.1 hypothetical protein [Candidatus Nanoarchaeia archaeon]
MVLVAILNALDVMAGITLIANIGFLLLPLGLFHFVKGGWTLYTSFKQGFFFEVLGGIDFLGGICCILAYHGIIPVSFLVIGIIMVIKGVFCFMIGGFSSS